MHRCGVNTQQEVLALANKISESSGLVFEGFQAYEGHLQYNRDADARLQGVREMEKKWGD